MTQQPLKVGDIHYLWGCFTEEYFLRGLSITQIARELGLPEHRFRNGIHIAWAIQLPKIHQFKLGGWAEFPTDKFVDYNEKGEMIWRRDRFEKTYKDKRVPITIEEAKKAWIQNMKHEKLIKVLMNIPGVDTDNYPVGGKASQILISKSYPLECMIVKSLSGSDVFRGVW